MMKERRKLMRRLYILTQEGRSYTEEGMRYIANKLEEKIGFTDPFVCEAGFILNNPEKMISYLTKFPSAFIVVSTDKDVIITGEEEFNEKFIEALNANPGKSSWEIAKMLCEG